ncbi:CrcB family protein [Arthrobacter sp. RT-1]|uniref:fluoride efflux transporter FluC n=1 Tax=Arthrobacter sp. RT-1 TaxID=2292263 RepID=UPI000E1ECB8C|nr:CrcB family protein [Arthrobacter sp. RT-1]RDV09522.1 CrcB family protein [Arthrobacter sp. RT-1]
MTAAALVGIFGVLGSLLRFAIDSWFAHHLPTRRVRMAGRQDRPHWPWATLLVNVLGCLIIGVSFGLTGRLGLPDEWHAGLATGLAGGLTTFSSWTTATVRLLSEARFGSAALNIVANLALGFAAAAAGIALAA